MPRRHAHACWPPPVCAGLWQRMSTKLLRLLVDLWAAVRQLFSKQLALVTCILIFTWMVAAFVYYGASSSALLAISDSVATAAASMTRRIAWGGSHRRITWGG